MAGNSIDVGNLHQSRQSATYNNKSLQSDDESDLAGMNSKQSNQEIYESGLVEYERLSLRDKVRYNKLLKKGIMMDYKNFRLLDSLKPPKKNITYTLNKFEFPTNCNFPHSQKSKGPIERPLITHTSPFINKTLLLDPVLKRRLLRRQKQSQNHVTNLTIDSQILASVANLQPSSTITANDITKKTHTESGDLLQPLLTQCEKVTLRLYPQPKKVTMEECSDSDSDYTKKLRLKTRIPSSLGNNAQMKLSRDRERCVQIHKKFNQLVGSRRPLIKSLQRLVLPSDEVIIAKQSTSPIKLRNQVLPSGRESNNFSETNKSRLISQLKQSEQFSLKNRPESQIKQGDQQIKKNSSHIRNRSGSGAFGLLSPNTYEMEHKTLKKNERISGHSVISLKIDDPTLSFGHRNSFYQQSSPVQNFLHINTNLQQGSLRLEKHKSIGGITGLKEPEHPSVTAYKRKQILLLAIEAFKQYCDELSEQVTHDKLAKLFGELLTAMEENDYKCAMGLIVQVMPSVSEYAIQLNGAISLMYNIPKLQEMIQDIKIVSNLQTHLIKQEHQRLRLENSSLQQRTPNNMSVPAQNFNFSKIQDLEGPMLISSQQFIESAPGPWLSKMPFYAAEATIMQLTDKVCSMTQKYKLIYHKVAKHGVELYKRRISRSNTQNGLRANEESTVTQTHASSNFVSRNPTNPNMFKTMTQSSNQKQFSQFQQDFNKKKPKTPVHGSFRSNLKFDTGLPNRHQRFTKRSHLHMTGASVEMDSHPNSTEQNSNHQFMYSSVPNSKHELGFNNYKEQHHLPRGSIKTQEKFDIVDLFRPSPVQYILSPEELARRATYFGASTHQNVFQMASSMAAAQLQAGAANTCGVETSISKDFQISKPSNNDFNVNILSSNSYDKTSKNNNKSPAMIDKNINQRSFFNPLVLMQEKTQQKTVPGSKDGKRTGSMVNNNSGVSQDKMLFFGPRMQKDREIFQANQQVKQMKERTSTPSSNPQKRLRNQVKMYCQLPSQV